jgi:lipid II:glycine glycyltransferase (peptidoglycan interpeptide bridge formation enzyme)
MLNYEQKIDKDSFNKKANHPLQTWEWGEFRKAWGNEVLRIETEKRDGQKQSLQITFSKIPLTPWKIGTILKGPLPTKEQLEELKRIGKEQKAIFIKLEPSFVKTTAGKAQLNKLTSLLRKFGCVKGRRLFTPTTFWIDLTPSEKDIFNGFSSKTRYNIRLAEKHGVIVTESEKDKDFEKYLQLTFETAKRQGFYAHTEKYHQLMWNYLHKRPKAEGLRPIARLLTATYKDRNLPAGRQVITTWIVFVWKNFLYYPYGASSDKYKNVMANNLMMWEAIRFGKREGLTTFDLWGREEGKGFTKFKEGYNPKVIEFIGTWDLVINKPLYCLYRIAEEIRWFFLKKIFR